MRWRDCQGRSTRILAKGAENRQELNKQIMAHPGIVIHLVQLGKLLQGAAGLAHSHLQGSSKSERECLYHLNSCSVSFAVLQAGCIHSLSKISASRQEGWLEGWLGAHCWSQHSAVPGTRLLSLPSCSLNLAGRNPSCWQERAESPFLCGMEVGEVGGELAYAKKSPWQLGGE